MAVRLRQSAVLLAAALSWAFVGSPAAARTACPVHFAQGAEPALVNPKLSRSARPLCFRAFAVLHSGAARAPIYAAEHLTRSSVQAAQVLDTRDNRFHAEPRLPRSERAELSDYARSGYDRRHLAPSGDMGDPDADHEGFSLANIVPQSGPLNRKGWADLEGYVRDLTLKLGEAYVVTGPAYEGARARRLKRRVLVPTSVWKAIYVPGQGAGAWIATNQASPKWKVMSIAQLAGRIGVDPFPMLDVATKRRVPAFPTFGARETRTSRR